MHTFYVIISANFRKSYRLTIQVITIKVLPLLASCQFKGEILDSDQNRLWFFLYNFKEQPPTIHSFFFFCFIFLTPLENPFL